MSRNVVLYIICNASKRPFGILPIFMLSCLKTPTLTLRMFQHSAMKEHRKHTMLAEFQKIKWPRSCGWWIYTYNVHVYRDHTYNQNVSQPKFVFSTEHTGNFIWWHVDTNFGYSPIPPLIKLIINNRVSVIKTHVPAPLRHRWH